MQEYFRLDERAAAVNSNLQPSNLQLATGNQHLQQQQ